MTTNISNKNLRLEGNLKGLGTIELQYRENENYDANTVPLNSTDNPLVGFSKTGEVLTETGREKFNPITDEIKLAADAYEYDFDPNQVLIKEKAEWDLAMEPVHPDASFPKHT